MTALLAPGAPRDGWALSRTGLHIPEGHQPRCRPIAVDLFAGAGGFSVGFKQAGFHVAAAVEFDVHATATYLVNLGGPGTVLHTDEFPGGRRCAEGVPDAGKGWISSEGHHGCRCEHTDRQCPGCHWSPEGCRCVRCVDPWPCEHFWMRDVRDITGTEILAALGLKPGEVDAVMGGPPCQGFSMSGKRDVMDPRNSLVFEFARLALEIQPKTFAMENVPGILSMVTPEGIPVLDALARVFSDGGFGTYDALRRSLRATTGTAAAVRTDPPPVELQPAAEEEAQLSLFD